jgi:hypothetical protein
LGVGKELGGEASKVGINCPISMIPERLGLAEAWASGARLTKPLPRPGEKRGAEGGF